MALRLSFERNLCVALFVGQLWFWNTARGVKSLQEKRREIVGGKLESGRMHINDNGRKKAGVGRVYYMYTVVKIVLWKLGEKNLLIRTRTYWTSQRTEVTVVSPVQREERHLDPWMRIRGYFCVFQCNKSYYFQAVEKMRQTGCSELQLALASAVRISLFHAKCWACM